MSLVALIFASCDQFDFEEAIPQHNPQEGLMSFEGLTVEKGASIMGDLDLNAVESGLVEVVKTAATPALAENQTIEYIAYVAKDETFENAVELTVEKNNVTVGDLNTAFRTLVGKTPKQTPLYIRFAAFVAEGSSWVRFGNKDTYFISAPVNVTPIPENFVVEEAYYIIGNMCNWSWKDMIKFNHSDKDVYDDPIFRVVFTCENDTYWKIIPQSSVDKGTEWADPVWGTAKDGDPATEGSLVNVNPQAGKIAEAGTYRMTIDMMNNTYKIEPVGDPFIYLVGNPNGWNINESDFKLESQNYNDIFTGTFEIADNQYFRFYKTLGNWDEGSIGSQLEDGNNIDVVFENGVYTAPVIDGGKGCFVVKNAGTYKMTVDLNSNTFRIEEAKTDPSTWTYLYIIGNINGWATDASATQGMMVCKDGSNVYTGTFDFPGADAANAKSYFRFMKELNGTWDLANQIGAGDADVELVYEENMAMGALVAENDKCFITTAGKYNVTVDLNENMLLMQQVVE